MNDYDFKYKHMDKISINKDIGGESIIGKWKNQSIMLYGV